MTQRGFLKNTTAFPRTKWECDFRVLKTATYWLGITFLFTLLSCSHITTPAARQQKLNALVQEQHWQTQLIKGDDFYLLAATPQPHTTHSQLVVYLEGDGLAWINLTRISNDPTPINPIALQLALKHPSNNAVYLARPCQYVMHKNAVSGSSALNCTPNTWTNARFSEEVTRATNAAIEQLKQQAQAQSLVLVGYSGGATLALLVAARRDDVQHIITVAGNLDHQAWTQLHNISPLTESLNPADYRAALQTIPQIHFVGKDDKNTPPELANTFLNKFAQRSHQDLRIIPHFDHQCCWVKEWARIYPELTN